MIKKYLFLFALLISVFVLMPKISAWWSVTLNPGGTTTHYKITQKAINQIINTQEDTAKCPDIVRFGDKIIEWTTWPGNDANAHGKKYNPDAATYNGGSYEWWWNKPDPNPEKADGILVKYNLRNFANGEYSAYYYLAMMAHLIADQGVPAHAANVKHGYQVTQLDPGDNFEGAADDRLPESGGTIELTDILHYYYYRDKQTQIKLGLIPQTQSKLTLSSWEHPTEHRQYWYENDFANVNDDYKYIGEAFYDTWGFYGGVSKQDIYSRNVDFTGAIIQTQFQDAVAFMDGFLRLVSRKLPPVVSNLQLVDQLIPGVIDTTITGTEGVKIKFTVDENRRPDIKIRITVNGKAIKDENAFIWDGGILTKVSLDANYLSDELPYKKAYGINWNGLLEDDTYPADGQHNIVVSVQDADGNWSNESATDVTYSSPIQVVKGRRPTFIATMSEDVDNSSLKMIIDGVTYSPFTYDFNIGKMVYKPTFDLEFGLHQCKIIGTDTAGNTIEGPTCTIKTEPTKIVIEDLDLSPRVTNGTTPLILKFKAKIK